MWRVSIGSLEQRARAGHGRTCALWKACSHVASRDERSTANYYPELRSCNPDATEGTENFHAPVPKSKRIAKARTCSAPLVLLLRPRHKPVPPSKQPNENAEQILTSVRVWVLNALELALSLLKEVSELPGVAHIAVALELDTDLDGPVSPDVPANAPIERVLEIASVERLDV